MKTMTVGELKSQLEALPDDMPVFLYNGLEEGDCELRKAVVTEKSRYCKHNSMIEEYFDAHGHRPVLLLHDNY